VTAVAEKILPPILPLSGRQEPFPGDSADKIDSEQIGASRYADRTITPEQVIVEEERGCFEDQGHHQVCKHSQRSQLNLCSFW